MLKDKIAVITGGGSGIGRAISTLFSRNGARSIILDNNADAAHRVVSEIERAGGKAASVCVDLRSSAAVKKSFLDVKKQTNTIDILVNNAGIDIFQTAVSLTEDEWKRCLDINLKAAWLCCKYSIPIMIRSRSGCIINIASTHAIRGHAGDFPYGVSKGGMLSLTLSLAADFGRKGVRANAICPGLVFTSLTQRYFASHSKVTPKQLVSLQPLPIRILPEDVANAALFLASDMGRCITGTTLFVDCGRSSFFRIPNEAEV
jgi:NAD(P)-dependent dehydrogenase (short-subunit alcohol dehydrogenase family)